MQTANPNSSPTLDISPQETYNCGMTNEADKPEETKAPVEAEAPKKRGPKGPKPIKPMDLTTDTPVTVAQLALARNVSPEHMSRLCRKERVPSIPGSSPKQFSVEIVKKLIAFGWKKPPDGWDEQTAEQLLRAAMAPSPTTSALPQGTTASTSDLPFRYQPGSAVRAGYQVTPGFEHVSLDEYERPVVYSDNDTIVRHPGEPISAEDALADEKRAAQKAYLQQLRKINR